MEELHYKTLKEILKKNRNKIMCKIKTKICMKQFNCKIIEENSFQKIKSEI